MGGLGFLNKDQTMNNKAIFNNGDLNPDPFYLPVEQARMLADFVGDSQMHAEIMDLVWEGENMIPIPQVYSEAWEELKKQKGL